MNPRLLLPVAAAIIGAAALLLFRPQQASTQQAQPVTRCSTMEVYQEHLLQHPDMETLDEFENWLQSNIGKQNDNPLAKDAIYTIPVIIHVVHNGESVGSGENISTAQVLEQIDVLNEDFRRMLGTPGYNSDPVGADTEIEFCPAEYDPQGNLLAVPGINRINCNNYGFCSSTYSTSQMDNTVKPATIWNPDDYLNIWSVDLSSSLLGFAQFPESTLGGLSSSPDNANTDGVVVDYAYFGRGGIATSPYDGGRTCTHEVGHYLGLRHIWGDGGCGVDDYCSDTPASDDSNSGCPNVTNCSSVDMVENYMDYTYDDCMDIFTLCQRSRMRFVMENSPRRNSLLSSSACSPPEIAPVAAFSADVTEGCPTLTVQFSDNSQYAPTSWSWSFPGGSPSTSTAANPTVTYDALGTYNVSLTATNAYGSDNATETAYINVTNSGVEDFFVETFEAGNFAATGWTVENPDGNNTFEIATVSGNSPGNQAAFVDVYDNDYPGARDAIISPVIDASGRSSLSLYFEHAHRRYSQNEHDSLIVYLSTDGGASFPHRLFADAENGSGNFATYYTTSSAFTPSSVEEWCLDSSVGSACNTLDLSAYDGQSNLRLKFEVYNDYGNNIYVDNITLSGTCAAAPVAASAKMHVWLQGAYTGNAMRQVLNDENTLPLAHPFKPQPWGYNGGESVAAIPANVTDWVLVEARSAANNNLVLAQRAAFVLTNGNIVDLDGTGDVVFAGLASGSYHLAVRQRNHVDLLGATAISLPNTTVFDFSVPANVEGGTSQLAPLGNNNYGMKAGDIDGNGVVSVADYNIFVTQMSFMNDYMESDLTLDGNVVVDDFNIYMSNAGAIGVSEIRY